ncbi:hypothetical protein O6H91_21G024300 [Diphasiastrum complanatum]|uniref:Uncharacterized protein n=1 Tax=Diphasiastrum complanatum TaxID=34168 RepID=A0ACC2AIR2_DIPCM|nr:hypothetical protein O6H91_21G024300 [Diphasiastrum complanatum]
MLANDDGGSVELNLDLCLGEAPTNSKCVSQCKRSREHDKELRTHRLADGCIKITTGFEDGREMTKIGDNTTGSQIKLAFDKHPTELFQTSCSAVCMRETDDQSEFPQGFSNTSRKAELPFAKYVPQDSSSSILRKSFSDVARHLSNAHAADAQYRKDIIHRQHVLDRQRKKELQAQKRQAARKKRKILIDEHKYQKMQLQKSRPFPCSPTHTQKSLGYGQRERSFEGLLERTSSEKSVASQRDKIHEKQSILQEERARFQDMRRAVQIERRRSAKTDKETTFGSKLKAGGDERNLKAGYSSDHKSSQLTEKHNKSETAQWIRKFHELHKLMNASPSTTQKKIPVSEMASNYSPLDASQIEFKNADQVDVLLLKKEEIPMDNTKKATSASDKDLESEDPKPPNDQIVSARKESSDSATTSLKAEPPAPSSFSRCLPTNADSFIQAPFAFSLQNVGGFSYPLVPYFVLAGASPFTSYSFSIPPHSTPLRMATLESTASSRTPVLQPTPVRHPRISTSNSSGRSRKQEPNCPQGEATLLPNETQARRVPPKPPL